MKKVWDTDELLNIWGLTYDERQLLKTKPPRNHLGFAIQLKHYQYTGRFIKSPSEIAETTLIYLSEQLEVPATDIDDYDWDGRSGKRHRTEI